jgi:hypothetical protein
MSALLIFAIGNTIARLALTLFIAVAIDIYADDLNKTERVGLGLLGGSSFMTIGPIWGSYQRVQTPYDQWSGFLMTMGCLIFAGGRMWRLHRHRLRNRRARDEARQYLAGRGRS